MMPNAGLYAFVRNDCVTFKLIWGVLFNCKCCKLDVFNNFHSQFAHLTSFKDIPWCIITNIFNVTCLNIKRN